MKRSVHAMSWLRLRMNFTHSELQRGILVIMNRCVLLCKRREMDIERDRDGSQEATGGEFALSAGMDGELDAADDSEPPGAAFQVGC